MGRHLQEKKSFWPLAALFGAILAVLMIASESFSQSRVEAARKAKIEAVKKTFAEAGVSYPPRDVFIRHYKKELELEVWARDSGKKKYSRIVTWPVCAPSGKLGPKRKEGDLQVPEGVYHVDRFNPYSNFHLSLGLNYPNRSDRILGDKKRPGGDIFIHGNCVTIGCIPIQDGPIEELYLICLDSKAKSGHSPQVHIFPCRMNEDSCKKELEQYSANDSGLASFWRELSVIHDYFETKGDLPQVVIDSNGRYILGN